MAEPADTSDNVGGQTNPLGLAFIIGLFALLWFQAGTRMFLVVVGLVGMLFLHELGHFLAARRADMKVTQFFLFMGPRLWSFKRGETEYGIRLLPIGAFVRVVGMNNLDPYAPADAARAYTSKSYPKRMLFITAGSLMHFLQALVLLLVVFSVIGTKGPANWSVQSVEALTDGQETPAVLADITPGDSIVAVDGIDVTNWRDLVAYVKPRPGEEVTITIARGDATVDRTVTLAAVPNRVAPNQNVVEQRGYLGVLPEYNRTRTSPILAVTTFGETLTGAVTSIPQFLSPSTFSQLLTLMFEGRAEVDVNSDEAQRPVSLIGATRFAGDGQRDITTPLMTLATINVFVGVLNLLPLLPLDGGHAAIATYERIRSRRGRRYRADVAKMLPLAYAAVAVLGFLMVSTAYLDAVRPIT